MGIQGCAGWPVYALDLRAGEVSWVQVLPLTRSVHSDGVPSLAKIPVLH